MSDEKIVAELQNMTETENEDAPKIVPPGEGGTSTASYFAC